MKNSVIHYFSGTGNTHRAASILSEQLRQSGKQSCVLNNIEQPRLYPADAETTHIVMFPVYAGAAPAMVLRYVLNLPPAQGATAVVIAMTGRTEHLHGSPMQALEQVARILKRKGFHVRLTDAVESVVNFVQLMNPPTPEAQQQILRDADTRIREIAERIQTQRTSLRPSAVVMTYAAWWFWAGYTLIGRRMLGKLYVADHACTSCGQCAHLCPASAIRLFHGIPRWNFQCEGCQRCINICQTHAIQVSFLRMIAMLGATLIFPIAACAYFLASHGIAVSLLFTMLTTIVATVCVDALVFWLELFPAFRAWTTAGHTRRYRRYLAPDFLKALARTHRNSLDNPLASHRETRQHS